MNAITIFSTSIRLDTQGRFCLNDLHRAAGGSRKHGPALWLTNLQTQALIDEIVQSKTDTGNPVSVVKGGIQQGTYVCRELVYAYAMWISAKFHLAVIRAFDDMGEAWFAILRHQAGCTMHRALARALQIHESTLSQVLNGSGYYGAGRCSTDHIARRVMRVFCAKQRIHPRQLSLV